MHMEIVPASNALQNISRNRQVYQEGVAACITTFPLNIEQWHCTNFHRNVLRLVLFRLQYS